MGDEGLQKAALELGLEDDIPLGEAVSAYEIQRAVGDAGDTPEVRGALSKALIALLDRNLIVVSRGPVMTEPTPVPPGEAAELLRDLDRFSWGYPSEEERVFYVNVENILPEYRPPWLAR